MGEEPFPAAPLTSHSSIPSSQQQQHPWFSQALSSPSERSCVTATSWPCLDPRLFIKGRKIQFACIAEEPGDSSKHNSSRKKIGGNCLFSPGTVSQKVCTLCDFDCPWDIESLLYGCLCKQSFMVSRKTLQLYFYNYARVLCRCSGEKQGFFLFCFVFCWESSLFLFILCVRLSSVLWGRKREPKGRLIGLH